MIRNWHDLGMVLLFAVVSYIFGFMHGTSYPDE